MQIDMHKVLIWCSCLNDVVEQATNDDDSDDIDFSQLRS